MRAVKLPSGESCPREISPTLDPDDERRGFMLITWCDSLVAERFRCVMTLLVDRDESTLDESTDAPMDLSLSSCDTLAMLRLPTDALASSGPPDASACTQAAVVARPSDTSPC